MVRASIRSGLLVFACAALLVVVIERPAAADPPAKKRVKRDREPPSKKRAEGDREPSRKKKATGDREPSRKKKAAGDREPQGKTGATGDRKPQGKNRATGDREPPRMKRVTGDRGPQGRNRVTGDREPPHKSRTTPADAKRTHRVQPRKSYVRTRRDYGHVRVTRHQRGHDGHLHIRPIVVRSARVSPVVLHRFEDRRQDQIRLMIGHLRENRRHQAMQIWTSFVDGLADYHEHVDLDDVMLYVAREGCFYGNDRVLFHAAKLEHLRESSARLDDYADLLWDQANACRSGARHCAAETVRDIEIERARIQADRHVLDLQTRMLDDQFSRVIASSHDYERSFADTYEDMYREVEVRISFSP